MRFSRREENRFLFSFLIPPPSYLSLMSLLGMILQTRHVFEASSTVGPAARLGERDLPGGLRSVST